MLNKKYGDDKNWEIEKHETGLYHIRYRYTANSVHYISGISLEHLKVLSVLITEVVDDDYNELIKTQISYLREGACFKFKNTKKAVQYKIVGLGYERYDGADPEPIPIDPCYVELAVYAIKADIMEIQIPLHHYEYALEERNRLKRLKVK